MKWASACSTEHDLEPATRQATEELGAALGQLEPDVLLAFAAGHDGHTLTRLPDLLRPWLGDGLLVGCNGSGVVGDGREVEDGPALALLAGLLTDVDVTVAHLEQAALPAVTASREAWWRLTGVLPEAEPGFTLIADPYSFDVEHCVRGLDRAYPGAVIVGGLTSAAAQPGQACLIAESDFYRSGALLVAWSGNIELDAVVSQGCRPVGDPLFVTAAEGNRIRELDGRSPRDTLGQLFGSLSDRDRAIFDARQLCIGLALPGPRQVVGPGDFLTREVVGLDADTGELVIGGRAGANSVVQFQLRDADTAAEDLERELARHRAADPLAPSAALMFSCIGRGTNLYEVPDRDSGLLRRAFGELPVGGLFCAGEVGPVQGATFLHGHTTIFGLIRPRRRPGRPR